MCEHVSNLYVSSFFFILKFHTRITSLQESFYRWMNKEKYSLYVKGYLKQVSNIE